MFSVEKRKLLFLLGCIPIRIMIAALPAYMDKSWLPYYGGMLMLPMMGFFYLYFNNFRLHAIESGGTTWWAQFRLLHAVLYLCAVIYAFQGNQLAWVPLIIDVMVGLVLFLNHHFA